MNAAVRPIHIPGAAALEALRQRAQAALDGWAREWVRGWTIGQQAAALHLDTACNAVRLQIHEFEAVRSGAGCIWFRGNAADRLSFGRAVVGAELMRDARCVDDWIAGLVEGAREARNHALWSGLLGVQALDPLPAGASEPPEQLFAFGSGAVQLSCDALGLFAIADSAAWRCVPPIERANAQRLPKPAALERAASRAKVRLDVMLGSVEVELPKLLDLRCGDVLRLPQRLDQGIAVLCEGKPLARAALGEAQGRKCVQVIARHQ